MISFLTVLIPAYNEADRIGRSLETICGHLKGQSYPWQIVVVDDGSRDATRSEVAKVAKRWERIRLICHDCNRGKGAAILTGLKAIENGAVLLYDADGSTAIETLDRFLPKLEEGADLVVGSRRIPGARIVHPQPWIRRWLGLGYQELCRLWVDWGITDFTCGFKLLGPQARTLMVRHLRVSGWSFDAEMFAIAIAHRLNIVQMPVEWVNRTDSRVRLGKDIWRSFWELVAVVIRRRLGRYR